MDNLTRRHLLGASAAFPVALTACTSLTSGGTLDVAAFSADLSLIVDSLEAVLSATSGLLTTATAAMLTADLAEAKTVIMSVGQAVGQVTLSTAQGWVTTVMGDARAILRGVATIQQLPPDILRLVNVVEALLPLVQVAVQLA